MPKSWETLTDVSYRDGMTDAASVGIPNFTAPFAGVNIDYVLTQDYMQLLANYTPLALNTAHPDYSDFVLVSEGPHQDQGGGVVRWTRTYAKTPAGRQDYASLAYNFIGYLGLTGINVTPIQYRPRVVIPVSCRIQYDYFLCGTGGSYATPDLIPTISEYKYYQPVGTFTLIAGVVTGTPTYPNPIQAALYGIPVDYLSDASGAFGAPTAYGRIVIGTVPTRTDYINNIIGTEIAAEPSQLSRWQGNIFVRTTKYVIAR